MCMPTKFETQNEPTMARTDIGSRNLNWIGNPASYELWYQSRRNDKQHEGNDTKSHAQGNMFIHVSYNPAGMIHFLQNRCREQIWEVASWAMLNTFTQRKNEQLQNYKPLVLAGFKLVRGHRLSGSGLTPWRGCVHKVRLQLSCCIDSWNNFLQYLAVRCGAYTSIPLNG